jgi:hypothetical protein
VNWQSQSCFLLNRDDNRLACLFQKSAIRRDEESIQHTSHFSAMDSEFISFSTKCSADLLPEEMRGEQRLIKEQCSHRSSLTAGGVV